MRRVYGVEVKLLKEDAEFFVDSRACERFQVNVGLRQGSLMSPWLFNVYMDGVFRDVNVRVLGKGLAAECKWWQV